MGTVKRENIGFGYSLVTIAKEDENYDKAKQRVIIGRTDDFLDEHKLSCIILCRQHRHPD